MQFKQISDGCFHDLDNERFIPNDPNNRHWQEMQRLIDAGEAEIIAYVEPEPDYAELRRSAYASTGDQLDMQYHDLVDGTTIWKEHVETVKATYPKPE